MGHKGAESALEFLPNYAQQNKEGVHPRIAEDGVKLGAGLRLIRQELLDALDDLAVMKQEE